MLGQAFLGRGRLGNHSLALRACIHPLVVCARALVVWVDALVGRIRALGGRVDASFVVSTRHSVFGFRLVILGAAALAA